MRIGRSPRPDRNGATASMNGSHEGQTAALPGPGEGVEVPAGVVPGSLDRSVRSDPPHLHQVTTLGDRGDAAAWRGGTNSGELIVRPGRTRFRPHSVDRAVCADPPQLTPHWLSDGR